MENISPQLRILSEAQKQQLYEAGIEVLNRVGVMVHNQEARQLLKKAGAKIDDHRVRIPAKIIDEAIRTAPNRFDLWDWRGESSLDVAPGKVYFGPGPTCTYFYDPVTGERRKARRGDAGTTAKVVDALPNIDFLMSLSFYDDVTPVLSPVYEFADMVLNTHKPILAWGEDVHSIKAIKAIAVPWSIAATYLDILPP